MKNPGLAAVTMAVALFAYAMVAQAQTADDTGIGGAAGQQDSAIQAANQQQGQQTDPKAMQKRFVESAMSCNQFEVDSAELAEQRAQRQEIKDLAQTLSQYHREANERLRPIAESLGAQTSEPMNPVHRALLDHLRQLQGKEFERAYLYTQVGGHHMDILKYRDIAQEAQDPQLKQYAQQTLPILQQHLEQVEALAGVEQAGTASDIQAPDAAGGAGGVMGGQTGEQPGGQPGQR